MSKKKFFLLLFFLFIFNNAYAKQLINNVIVSIDNSIITELDINKEINFLKFINKDQVINNPEVFKKEIINSLVDRKIKDIETNNLKIEVTEKEVENNLYNYLERMKINNEILNSFYNGLKFIWIKWITVVLSNCRNITPKELIFNYTFHRGHIALKGDLLRRDISSNKVDHLLLPVFCRCTVNIVLILGRLI